MVDLPKYDLSVVVCSKNNNFELQRTISSLFSCKNVEIVVVTAEIDDLKLQGLTDYMPNIRFFKDSGDGIYSAMNLGIKMATGIYILFLNAGDELYSSVALMDLVAKITKTNASWGFGQTLILKSNGNFRITNLRKYSLFLNFLSIIFVPHPSTIYRRQYIMQIEGYDLNYKIAADQKLSLQFALDSKPEIANDVISVFRLGGVSSRKNIEIIRDFKRIFTELNVYIMPKYLINIFFGLVYLLRLVRFRKF